MNDVTQFWNFWYYKTQQRIKKETILMLVGQYYVFPINNIQQCQEFQLVWNCVPNDSYLLYVNRTLNELWRTWFHKEISRWIWSSWTTIPVSSGIDSFYFEKTWKGICFVLSYKTFLSDPKYIAPPRGLLRRPKKPPGKLGC